MSDREWGLCIAGSAHAFVLGGIFVTINGADAGISLFGLGFVEAIVAFFVLKQGTQTDAAE